MGEYLSLEETEGLVGCIPSHEFTYGLMDRDRERERDRERLYRRRA
jgi:hypothetical protein